MEPTVPKSVGGSTLGSQRDTAGSFDPGMVAVFAALVGIAILWLYGTMGRIPSLDELSPTEFRLTSKPAIDCPPKSGSCSLKIPVTSGSIWIHDICYLWGHCDDPGPRSIRLPEDIATLGDGDVVQAWVSGPVVWQLATSGHKLLTYDQLAAKSRAANATAEHFAYFSFAISAVAAVIWCAKRVRRSRKSASGSPQSNS
jgi:hypothetical protein